MKLLAWFCLVVLSWSCDSDTARLSTKEKENNDKIAFKQQIPKPFDGVSELKRIDSLLVAFPGDCYLLQKKIDLLYYNGQYNKCLAYLEDNRQCFHNFDELNLKVDCNFKLKNVRLFDSLRIELSKLAYNSFRESPNEVTLIDYLVVLKKFGYEEEIEPILERNLHLISKRDWYRENTKIELVQALLGDIDVLEMP